MKIYTFLKKPDQDMLNDESIDLTVKYALYAITPVKDDAKTFKKSRNMSFFIEREIDVDEEDADQYLLRHRGQILNRYWMISYQNKNTDNQTPYWMQILMTENELNFTMETSDSGSILNRISNWVPIDIFDGKTKKALYKLRYDKAMQCALSMSASEKLENLVSFDQGDFWDIGLSFDMFAIFMILYQSTFSVDFFAYANVSYEEPKEETYK